MFDKIEHFIVLMLENRSFDHMFGYLDHPDPTFKAVGRLANPPTTKNARYSIYPGPDHSHRGVLHQILGLESPPSYPNAHYELKMNGFAANYELHAPGRGQKVMRCFDPRMIPVLSTLALEFAVCDQWFCSLPGETWPNRDFLHAGTSFGQVDVHKWVIWSNPPTIFSALEKPPAPKPTWRVYHQGVGHIFLYSQLFLAPNRRGSHAQLIDDIKHDRLPSYAFVEPDYGLPGAGNSQHPSQACSREEFVDGEAFIAEIYEALRATPAVFEKTAFIITYDEHGGFYDHVPPWRGGMPDADAHRIHRNGNYMFAFEICGPRVPAVVVSPWINRGTVDHTERDHSCVAETIRKRFLADVCYPLNDRAETTDLSAVFNREAPRRGNELPEVRPLSHDEARDLETRLAAPPDESDLNPEIDYSMQTAMHDLRKALAQLGFPL